MLFMAAAGLWALLRGSITITRSLTLEGRRARLYGATLMGIALVLFLLSPLLESITPTVFLENDAARILVNVLIAAAVVVGLAAAFRARGGA